MIQHNAGVGDSVVYNGGPVHLPGMAGPEALTDCLRGAGSLKLVEIDARRAPVSTQAVILHRTVAIASCRPEMIPDNTDCTIREWPRTNKDLPLNSPARSTGVHFDLLHHGFAAEIADIDRALVACLHRLGEPASHYGMLRYHFGFADVELQALTESAYLPRGKRLRPLICLLFCRIYRVPEQVATTLMMAVEVMHSASLAHDDIEDCDAVRWNRPTLQAVFGVDQAINAGDTLIGMVYQLLLELTGQGVAPTQTLDVIASFNRAHLRMCEGQHLDLKRRYDDASGATGYLDMVERKTGAPCVCIGESVASVAALPASTRATLGEFGRSLGVLYQICDDVRGLFSQPDALGREIGHDLVLRRPSLPLLYGCQHGSTALRALLQADPGRATPLSADELSFVRSELVACGVGRYCRDAALRHHDVALTALNALNQDGVEIRTLRGLLHACLASVEFPN